MNANDVIEAYVTDVAARLPRKQRNDVAFELRALLNEGLQDKADAAGRAADAAMAIELAQTFGRPADVAARYLPALTIIDPADGHRFLRATVIGLAIIWCLGLCERLLQPIDSDAELLGVLAQWLLGTVVASLWWPGVLVAGFAAAAWTRRRSPQTSVWKPNTNEIAPGSRAGMVLGLVGIAFGIFVLIEPRWVLDFFWGGRAAPAAYAALNLHRHVPPARRPLVAGAAGAQYPVVPRRDRERPLVGHPAQDPGCAERRALRRDALGRAGGPDLHRAGRRSNGQVLDGADRGLHADRHGHQTAPQGQADSRRTESSLALVHSPTPSSVMEIRVDDLTSPHVIQLLREHLQDMARHSPPESIHALDLDALRKPEITFWSVWQGEALMGCGALKRLDAAHGEIKSMRTAAPYLRQGVAAAMLKFILEEAPRLPSAEPENRRDTGLRAGAPSLCRLRIRALRPVRGLCGRPLQRVHDQDAVA